jgi:hypothetical protein
VRNSTDDGELLRQQEYKQRQFDKQTTKTNNQLNLLIFKHEFIKISVDLKTAQAAKSYPASAEGLT